MTRNSDGHQPDALAISDAPSWLFLHGFDLDVICALTDSQLMQTVGTAYDGGWEAFVDHATAAYCSRLRADARDTGGVGAVRPPYLAHHCDPAAVSEARGWLLDCGFDEDTLDELLDWQIVRLVDKIYEGGWTAFLDAIVGLFEGPEATSATPEIANVNAGAQNSMTDPVASRMAFVIAKAAVLGVIADDIPEPQPGTDESEQTT